jgi:hypothetical protein
MSDSKSLEKRFFPVVLLVIIVFLCWMLDTTLTESPIRKDARQNLQAAYNVSEWGVFSITASASGKPPADNYREPVTPYVTSLLIGLYKKNDPALTFEDLSEGTLCLAVKRINILWAFFLLLGSSVLVVFFTRSPMLAAFPVCLIWLAFLRNPAYIDTIGTEIPTAAVMVWTSVALIGSLRSGRGMHFLGTALLFGMLCLTKAVFLYLTVPVVLIIFFCTFTDSYFSKLRAISAGVVFMVGVTITVGPWLSRNYNQLGSATLTLRGGSVLYGRTRLNTMTMDEVIAGMYLWGPGAYKTMVKNTVLEMSTDDFEEGGRGVRLNRSADSSFAKRDSAAEKAGKPEDAISFLRQIRAERVRLLKHFASAGHLNPQQATDDFLKGKAREWLLENPVRHVMMTFLFAWRGVWCFYGGGVFTVLNALCAAVFIALTAYGICAGNRYITAFVLLPFLMLCFNALFTHNLSRYSSPAIPFLITGLFVAIHLLGSRQKKTLV